MRPGVLILIPLPADGMFAILIPTSLAPLIVTLVWAERKAKRLGLVPEVPVEVSMLCLRLFWY